MGMLEGMSLGISDGTSLGTSEGVSLGMFDGGREEARKNCGGREGHFPI